ncbi:hypothetical protein [Mariniblastus fucicola]|uniref:hypothetical protein n=1 Tax=Mariniblastus fucicola TaxID=980251 RepID=UPI0009462541|nr:hypothetical protein [Mariniblastus fucicola]
MIKNSGTFSADVKLLLHIGSEQFEIGSLGPDYGILRDELPIESGEGVLETIVDNQSTRWNIRFTSPITGEAKRFTFEAV